MSDLTRLTIAEARDRLRAKELTSVELTEARLVNWIDRGIPHPDITKPAARVFIQRALEAVIKAGSYSLERLARHKYEVRRALAEEIKSLREGRKRPASPLCRVC